jgi:hypothetical protein
MNTDSPKFEDADILVLGSTLVFEKLNCEEELSKITNNLAVDEFNIIVCAMIDHLFEEKLIEMPPPIEDPQEWKWKGYEEPKIGYFWLDYPNDNYLKENLQMDGGDIMQWDSDNLQQVCEAIDTIPIDGKKWGRYDWQIREELEKIKMIIHNIISVISAIYETTYTNRDKFWKLTTPDHRDIYSDIYVELIKKYYYILGDLEQFDPNA